MWRPGKTAPTTGQVVLIWEGFEDTHPVTAYWNAQSDCWCCAQSGDEITSFLWAWWDFGDGATMPPLPSAAFKGDTTHGN